MAGQIPIEEKWAPVIRALSQVAENFMPRMMSRGVDLTGVPKPLRPLVKNMTKPESIKIMLPAMLLTHPIEDRVLTEEEARAFFADLMRAFMWAFSQMPGGLSVDDIFSNQHISSA